MAGKAVGSAPVLEGKVALVTGAGQGIGLTIAEAFLRAGAQVGLLDRDRERLEAAMSELGAAGYKPLPLWADVCNEAHVDGAVSQVLAAFGRLDVLVNNAALLMSSLGDVAGARPMFWEIEPERWRELWDVNVTGTWLCCRRVAPEMIRAGRGSIANVTTSYHTMRSPAHIPYGTSKAALEAFTEAAARQLRPHGVRVNALLPGRAVNRRGEANPDLAAADTIVHAALYLASDASLRVTGRSIIADEFNREHGRLPAGSQRAD